MQIIVPLLREKTKEARAEIAWRSRGQPVVSAGNACFTENLQQYRKRLAQIFLVRTANE
jgi:hypothetical protein